MKVSGYSVRIPEGRELETGEIDLGSERSFSIELGNSSNDTVHVSISLGNDEIGTWPVRPAGKTLVEVSEHDFKRSLSVSDSPLLPIIEARFQNHPDHEILIRVRLLSNDLLDRTFSNADGRENLNQIGAQPLTLLSEKTNSAAGERSGKFQVTAATVVHVLCLIGILAILNHLQHRQGFQISKTKGSSSPNISPIGIESEIESNEASLAKGKIGDSLEFDLGKGQKLTVKYVPSGSFITESKETNDQKKTITLSQNYWIGETEVTQEQWKALMDDNPSRFDGIKNLPVENLSWEDAKRFIKILNKRINLPEGWEWELPTSRMWERACRAGSDEKWFFGNDEHLLENHAWYNRNSGNRTHPVMKKKPNPWGLYDVYGNVSEWTLNKDEDPNILGGRVVRGGKWDDSAWHCSSDAESIQINGRVGFRIALVCNMTPEGPSKNFTNVNPKAKSVAVDDFLSRGDIGDSHEFELGNGEALIMRYVPGGTFTMGSALDEPGRDGDEEQVDVTLRSHFWIGETEVTDGQWKSVMRGIGDPASDFNDRPVVQINWYDATNFAKRLNDTLQLPKEWMFSLPTEAQWERACRAGTHTAFSFGDRLSSSQANFDGSKPYGGAPEGPTLGIMTPVKRYPPNKWGLYDMHGNVLEWCLDRWDGKSDLPGGVDPLGDSGLGYIFRGGAFTLGSKYCRSAERNATSPMADDLQHGFRVVLKRRSFRVSQPPHKEASDQTDPTR